jgi:acyl-CoA thioesterase-1
MPRSRSPLRSLSVCLALAAVSACSIRDAACGRPAPATSRVDTGAAPAAAAAPNRVQTPGSRVFKIVYLGDSLTEGFGLTTQDAYPARIQAKFEAEGYDAVETVNAGVSGDTTAGALRRLDNAIETDSRILVVALGGNDALRGLSTTQTSENLAKIIEGASAKGLTILLAGMQAPTNYGPDYRERFAAVFPDLARAYHTNVTYVPFLLEGVAGVPALNQPDGIHPNVEGAKAIAEMLYPKLKTLVDSMGGGGV